jgi:hypothetical protein
MMIKDTIIAAEESAMSPSMLGKMVAMADATSTARLLIVSAHTC